ncbi:g4417 [Coccomyxa elongata]
MRFLILTGSPPAEFYSRAKLKEVMNVVEHLHQREDNYRRKIKDLQEELEAQHRDKKKALAKLQKARMESQNGLGDVGEGISLRRSSSEGPGNGVRRWGVHLSVLLAIVAVVLFFEHGKCPVLVRKVVWTILCPTCFVWVWSLSSQAPVSFTAALYCSCWFLLGYLFNEWTRML